MEKALSDIVAFIKLSKGSDLSLYNQDFLQHNLDKRLEDVASPSLAHYFQLLKKDPEETEKLVRAFRITYSEFFRDPLVFSLLWKWMIPAILFRQEKPGKKDIRVWSAATAAGQEAYSLAMVFDDARRLYPDKDISLQIFASDLCHTEIEKAKEGFYTMEQLQKVPFKFINEYFYPTGKGYRLIPRIRESVKFFTYDLLSTQTTSPPESIFGSFDLIYCSNLFIYYNDRNRKKIINKLLKNLENGGLLITGDSEKEVVSGTLLNSIFPPAPIFRKPDNKENFVPPDGAAFHPSARDNVFFPPEN